MMSKPMDEETKRMLRRRKKRKRRASWRRRRERDAKLNAESSRRHRGRIRKMIHDYFALKEAGDPFPAGKVLDGLKSEW